MPINYKPCNNYNCYANRIAYIFHSFESSSHNLQYDQYSVGVT